MIVHFGGSQKGFKKYEEFYKLIRKIILDSGCTIADDWIVDRRKTKDIKKIFEITEKSILKSDAVIIEETISTSSIGKQLMIALYKEKPVLLLDQKSEIKKENFVSSKMSKKLIKKTYSYENIYMIINDFLKWANKVNKIRRFNLVIDKKLDDFLEKKSKKYRTSKSEEIRKLIERDMLDSN